MEDGRILKAVQNCTIAKTNSRLPLTMQDYSVERGIDENIWLTREDAEEENAAANLCYNLNF